MANKLVKLWEKIAAKRVTKHLEINGKLSKEVGGARAEALVNTMQKGLLDKQHLL